MAQGMVLTREGERQTEKMQKSDLRESGQQGPRPQSVIVREVQTSEIAQRERQTAERSSEEADRKVAALARDDGVRSATAKAQEYGSRTAGASSEGGVQAVVLRPADDHMQEVVIRPQDGYFIRDLARDEVICPAGNILHRKCTKSNGYTRYMSKASCSRCEAFRKCYSGKRKWKEIDFSDGALVVRCRNWTKEE